MTAAAPEEEIGIEILTGDEVLEADVVQVGGTGVEIGIGSTFSEQITQEVLGIEVDFGVPGPPGADGAPGAGNQQLEFSFTNSATWVIQHNLDKYPNVKVFLSSNLTEEVFTDITYTDRNNISISHPSPASGRATVQ